MSVFELFEAVLACLPDTESWSVVLAPYSPHRSHGAPPQAHIHCPAVTVSIRHGKVFADVAFSRRELERWDKNDMRDVLRTQVQRIVDQIKDKEFKDGTRKFREEGPERQPRGQEG